MFEILYYCTMHSPLKGIDRLSEELRIERQKATEALQEVTRQRVEIASLSQSNDSLNAMYEDLKEQCSLERAESDAVHNDLINLEAEYNHLKSETDVKLEEYQHLYHHNLSLQSENDSLKDTLHDKESQLAAVTIKCNSLESRSNAKEELLNKLKSEIQDIRHNYTTIEQEKLNIIEELKNQEAWNEELKLELGKFEVMSDGYNQTRSSNDELRAELDSTLQNTASYMEQIRELNLKLKEKLLNENNLQDIITNLIKEKEILQKECNDIELNRNQINERIQAEIIASEESKKYAETTARGREFLDIQLNELQEKHREVLNYNTILENNLNENKIIVTELHNEISNLREKLINYESSSMQNNNVQAMVIEIDSLRHQLNEMRREMLKRGIEEDAGVIPPKAVIDRVEESKQVGFTFDRVILVYIAIYVYRYIVCIVCTVYAYIYIYCYLYMCNAMSPYSICIEY